MRLPPLQLLTVIESAKRRCRGLRAGSTMGTREREEADEVADWRGGEVGEAGGEVARRGVGWERACGCRPPCGSGSLSRSRLTARSRAPGCGRAVADGVEG
jgi:hypothetical protein